MTMTVNEYVFFPDINECSRGEHICAEELALCFNTHGSYMCQCNDGYTGTGFAGECYGESLFRSEYVITNNNIIIIIT